MKILHKQIYSGFVQDLSFKKFIFQVDVPKTDEIINKNKETEKIKLTRSILRKLKNENENMFNLISKQWDKYSLEEKLNILSAEGRKGTIEYTPIESNYNSSLAVIKSNLLTYNAITIGKTTYNGENMNMSELIKKWENVNNESFHTFLKKLNSANQDDRDEIIEKAVLHFFPYPEELLANIQDQINEKVLAFKQWYKEYLKKGQCFIEGEIKYDFISMEDLLTNGYGNSKGYGDGMFVGNAVISNDQNILTAKHVTRKSTHMNNSKEYDFTKIKDNKNIPKHLTHPLSKILDIDLNGKEVQINGVDYNHNTKKYEQASIKGRAFLTTEDITEYLKSISKEGGLNDLILMTKKGSFMILIENNEINDYKKLPGVSGAPVFFNSPKIKEREIVGIFTGRMKNIIINETNYLAVFFSGPSILNKKE